MKFLQRILISMLGNSPKLQEKITDIVKESPELQAELSQIPKIRHLVKVDLSIEIELTEHKSLLVAGSFQNIQDIQQMNCASMDIGGWLRLSVYDLGGVVE